MKRTFTVPRLTKKAGEIVRRKVFGRLEMVSIKGNWHNILDDGNGRCDCGPDLTCSEKLGYEIRRLIGRRYRQLKKSASPSREWEGRMDESEICICGHSEAEHEYDDKGNLQKCETCDGCNRFVPIG